MKRSDLPDLLCAAVLGLVAVAVQAAEPEFNKECAMGLAMKKPSPPTARSPGPPTRARSIASGTEEARKEFLKAPDTNIAGAETFWSP